MNTLFFPRIVSLNSKQFRAVRILDFDLCTAQFDESRSLGASSDMQTSLLDCPNLEVVEMGLDADQPDMMTKLLACSALKCLRVMNAANRFVRGVVCCFDLFR